MQGNNINLDNEQSALAKVIWRNALSNIQTEISKILFVTWVEPLVPFYVDENTLWLCVPDEISFRYLNKYVGLFENAILATNSFRLDVKLVIGPEQMQAVLKENLTVANDTNTVNVANTTNLTNISLMADNLQSAPAHATTVIAPETSLNKPLQLPSQASQAEQIEQATQLQFADNKHQFNANGNNENSSNWGAIEHADSRSNQNFIDNVSTFNNVNNVSNKQQNYYQVHFNKEYTFESFVVGPNNTMAHAACVAIADSYVKQNSVKPYNPLFLYGGSGLGKTHLLNAIGNRVLEHNPQAKILYVQTEDFVNEFISTIKKQNYNVFREKYRNCDLLLIDDIQFIEGKEQMQEEFFYTFNKLYELNSSIVMTCDKHPRYLVTLEERLRTRFLSGLACDINPPNYETRVAILMSRTQVLNEDIDIEIISYIAKNISVNIRELEGALNSVLAIKHLSGHINLALAKKALEPVIKQSEKQSLTPDFIADIVANYYNVAKSQLYAETRQNKITHPRHVAMYLCRELLNMTYTAISQAFNRSDHTTTRNACLKIESNLDTDLQLQKELASIKKSLHES